MGNENKITVAEAIKIILENPETALTADEIYKQIVERGLYKFGAINPKGVVSGKLRKHCIGLDFPSAEPVKYFRLVGDDKYALESKEGVRAKVIVKPSIKSSNLPEETIEYAYAEHLSQMRQQLKEKILGSHPVFFEKLVIDVLIRMGYGGSNPALGIHTGGPGDGGIDGIIKEDKLGLEKIYIQAKRYALDRDIKRTDVQRFAGAMNKVKKGVFITTSMFATNARQFAKDHEKSISLIDGDMLCDLMISHGVGVSEIMAYKVLRVDNDYFPPAD
jgi:restriction system protein